MQPVNPLATTQEFRLKLPADENGKDITIYLSASDAGDGNENDHVEWQQPRLRVPGTPDLLVRDVRAVIQQLSERRARLFANTRKYLAAAAELAAGSSPPGIQVLAEKHGVERDGLAAWCNYLGFGETEQIEIKSYFTNKMLRVSKYDFINGWGVPETPIVVANSSDQAVRIPGNMPPHSVAMHPSPKLQAVVSWRSPVRGRIKVEGTVTHAHPECGNGVTWFFEWRHGNNRRVLARGVAQGGEPVKTRDLPEIKVNPGDYVSVLIGPQEGNHACDLTTVDLNLTLLEGEGRTWNLARDVSSDLLAANPHADSFGNLGVWHFYTEPDAGGMKFGRQFQSARSWINGN